MNQSALVQQVLPGSLETEMCVHDAQLCFVEVLAVQTFSRSDRAGVRNHGLVVLLDQIASENAVKGRRSGGHGDLLWVGHTGRPLRRLDMPGDTRLTPSVTIQRRKFLWKSIGWSLAATRPSRGALQWGGLKPLDQSGASDFRKLFASASQNDHGKLPGRDRQQQAPIRFITRERFPPLFRVAMDAIEHSLRQRIRGRLRAPHASLIGRMLPLRHMLLKIPDFHPQLAILEIRC